MAGTLLEQTRSLHEDIERLEYAAVQFLLEEPKTHKDSINQTHMVNQALTQIIEKKDKLLHIYKDADNSRRDDADALTGQAGQAFPFFYERLREIKDYHRKFPDVQIGDPQEILSGIIGCSDSLFTTEESYGKYVDLHLFHDRYNNLPWIKSKPVDYFTYLDRAYNLTNQLSGKGQEYLQYLKDLIDYSIGHIQRSQPLLELDSTLESIKQEFSAQWDDDKFFVKQTKELMDSNSSHSDSPVPPTYCFDCKKNFAKATSFNSHLKGKKHKKAAAANAPIDKEIFQAEYLLQRLGELLRDQIDATKIHVETKLARRYEDIEADLDDETPMEGSDSETDDEEEMTRRCITNYPVGWDGKPIPYWLYKLHGLGIEYKCEICGNTPYLGRRAFERHFQEWRHAYGMRCLGIPNSKHFNEITSIRDALLLWEKIKENKQTTEWNANELEEFEDNEGNVMNRKTYKDLERQGLV